MVNDLGNHMEHEFSQRIYFIIIAYMIYHGWALLFFLLGIASSNAWLIAIGSTVMLFWFGPSTPVVPLIIVTGIFI